MTQFYCFNITKKLKTSTRERREPAVLRFSLGHCALYWQPKETKSLVFHIIGASLYS